MNKTTKNKFENTAIKADATLASESEKAASEQLESVDLGKVAGGFGVPGGGGNSGRNDGAPGGGGGGGGHWGTPGGGGGGGGHWSTPNK